MLKHLRTVLAALTATTVLVSGIVNAPTASSTPLYDNTKLGSFFHESHANRTKMRNGKLVRIREIGNRAVPCARVYQYVFKTTNTHDKAVLASAAVSSWFVFPWILGRFAGLPPSNNTC